LRLSQRRKEVLGVTIFYNRKWWWRWWPHLSRERLCSVSYRRKTARRQWNHQMDNLNRKVK